MEVGLNMLAYFAEDIQFLNELSLVSKEMHEIAKPVLYASFQVFPNRKYVRTMFNILWSYSKPTCDHNGPKHYAAVQNHWGSRSSEQPDT